VLLWRAIETRIQGNSIAKPALNIAHKQSRSMEPCSLSPCTLCRPHRPPSRLPYHSKLGTRLTSRKLLCRFHGAPATPISLCLIVTRVFRTLPATRLLHHHGRDMTLVDADSSQ